MVSKRKESMLTQEIVRELLDYDPETGVLTWKQRDRKYFKSDWDWKKWNTKHAEKPALTAYTHGYLHGRIFGRAYRAHRIIFLMMTGCWPDSEVDHENRDRADNRWENLYEKSHQKNSWNMSLRKDNTTGHVGVYVHGESGMYRAQIYTHGKQYHLGAFKTFEEAVAVRKAAQIKQGFASGHGMPPLVEAANG